MSRDDGLRVIRRGGHPRKKATPAWIHKQLAHFSNLERWDTKGKFTPTERTALVLYKYYREGLAAVDIAEQLDMTPGAVRQLIHRMTKKYPADVEYLTWKEMLGFTPDAKFMEEFRKFRAKVVPRSVPRWRRTGYALMLLIRTDIKRMEAQLQNLPKN